MWKQGFLPVSLCGRKELSPKKLKQNCYTAKDCRLSIFSITLEIIYFFHMHSREIFQLLNTNFC